MSEDITDITRSVFSIQEINNRIGFIFRDSAILDTRFNIVTISQNVLEATGYTGVDLRGQSVSVFTVAKDFKILLEEQLKSGYFEEQLFDVRCRNEETVTFRISGFYMGLIADINGLIVLRLKNPAETSLVNEELLAKTKELDDFVYASSHSLRGPLATLKGLINLVTTAKDKQETEFLVQQMNIFAERLDKKLHQLIFVAESDKNPKFDSEALSIQSMYDSLLVSVNESSIDYPIHFFCPVLDRQQLIGKGEMVLSMINNLTLFFCQQPKCEQNVLIFDALSSSSAIEIVLRSKGFLFSDALIEKIKNVNFGYSEILQFPELINYYAAKKIMLKLNGHIQFMLIATDEVVVLMTVPLDSQLSLF